ncbi:MAG TPA: DedA family protein [Elusimicrobiales bacterium]|nr:DedA family protein [Elusimicrobiales bacterium]
MAELLAQAWQFLVYAFNVFMHLDKHLGAVIQSYGSWTYLILFLIIFCETGLVVTPILPGDSLLFAIGVFCGLGHLDIYLTLALLCLAAVLGDSVNYGVGKYMGPKVFHYENSRIFRKEYLAKTHAFYEKYGGKTIIIARFVPIVRTFAPFVAGVGAMTYGKFLAYNVAGGVLWVFVVTLAGFFFGNIPVVKNNFTAVIMGIVFVSILPGLVEYLRHRRSAAPKSAA